MARKKDKKVEIGERFNGMDVERSIASAIDGLATYEPTSLGLPDLIIEQQEKETKQELHLRQDKTIKGFIEENLYLNERGKRRKIELIPQQVELIADLFYRRETKAIVWKNRGGGGTLCAAMVMWLSAIWRHFSWVNLAGSAEQAKAGYAYTFQFWDCMPTTKNLIKGDALQTMTQLRDGTYLKCLTNSEKSSRSKHPPGLLADEACQDDPRKDKNLESALQMVLSNEEYTILILSTFHHARGFFQKMWDTATERGFKRYKWDQFDTLRKCTFGMERATPEDPKALAVCRTECPLTVKKRAMGSDGELSAWKYIGCQGRARLTAGYLPRENAIDALKINDSETSSVEHWCERPSISGPIYDSDKVDLAFAHGLSFELTDLERASEDKSVGVDWGLVGQTAVIGPLVRRQPGGIKSKPFIVGTREQYFTGDSLEEITAYFVLLQKECGKFTVYADASHPFNNLHLQNAGFHVEQVAFSTWKDFGIKNVARWLDHVALMLGIDMVELRRTLKAYHRGPDGKPVKKDDHGPDAIMAALLKWIWEQETQGIEDIGDTDVRIFKREPIIRVAPPEIVVPPSVRVDRITSDEPKLFRLRSGVAWNVIAKSGRTYRFRGQAPIVVHFVVDQEFFREKGLEEVSI